jgi:hypothetical protein
MQEVTRTVNGIETTLLLSDEDAANVDTTGFRRHVDLADVDEKQANVSTKARKSTDNKSA